MSSKAERRLETRRRSAFEDMIVFMVGEPVTWIDHPSYIPKRDALVEQFRSRAINLRLPHPVVFLCGAHESRLRDFLRDRIAEDYPTVRLFYAETVWNLVKESGESALAIEDQLAHLSDLVVVVVESPGTFAELGAFSASAPLRMKIVLIIDDCFKGVDSFINTGPVRWISNEKGKQGGIIYTPFQPHFDPVPDLGPILERASTNALYYKTFTGSDLAENLKLLLFFLCDIVAIAGPLREHDVTWYIRESLGTLPTMSIETLLGLGVALGLLRSDSGSRYKRLYYRPLTDGEFVTFADVKGLKPTTERMRLLSAMMQIPQAVEDIVRARRSHEHVSRKD